MKLASKILEKRKIGTLEEANTTALEEYFFYKLVF